MLASSLGIYSAEHKAQPEAFKNAFSGMWWSISTMLTVGYGDIYPITYIGKIMAMFIELLGVGVVAIPTGIISAGFVEQYTKKQHSDAKFTEMSQIGEIFIDENNELIGLSINELKSEYEIRIFVILRDGLTIIPTDNIIISLNDILIVQSDKFSN
jgi:voltage-gated potassium channel